MSEKITAANLDWVITQNQMIRTEMEQYAMLIRTTCNKLQVSSSALLAFQILKTFGLIQMPVDNPYLSGAIYVRKDKKIPFINTAIPRVNQYFTAWHEIYHLFFDTVSFDHIIDVDTYVEERKAEYFASLMLLGNLMPYFTELPEDMHFQSKVYHCMAVFQAPYKAVLISLYESAVQYGNTKVAREIKEYFDIGYENMAESFRRLGLDDTLVKPSYVVNLGELQTKINEKIRKYPEFNYHKDNKVFLDKKIREISLLIGEKND